MYTLAYPFLALADILVTLFAWSAVNWWVPIFADRHGYLPRWLKWFQTFDASLDWGWQGGTPGFNPDGSQHWNRVKWIYRNPAYGFAYWALGISFDPARWRVRRFVSTPSLELFVATGPNGLFNLYYHGRLGMLKLGWKAWNYYDTSTGRWKTKPWGPVWRAPATFSVSPFKRRR